MEGVYIVLICVFLLLIYCFIVDSLVSRFLKGQEKLIEAYNIERHYLHRFKAEWKRKQGDVVSHSLGYALGWVFFISCVVAVYAFFSDAQINWSILWKVGVSIFSLLSLLFIYILTKKGILMDWEECLCPHCGAPLSMLLKNENRVNEKYFTKHVANRYQDEHGKYKTEYIPVDYIKYDQHSKYECVRCHKTLEKVEQIEKRI